MSCHLTTRKPWTIRLMKVLEELSLFKVLTFLVDFKAKKIKKDPSVNTAFLPDKDREEYEQKERERLKKIWMIEQEEIKRQSIIVTYSYWDGSGHRAQVDCVKGDSISQFLEKVRKQWHELRGVNVENLIFIKEDLIIPHVSSSWVN